MGERDRPEASRRDARRLMLSTALAGLLLAGAAPAWTQDGRTDEPALIQQLLDDNQAIEGERRARAALEGATSGSAGDRAVVADLNRLLGDALYLQQRYAEAEPHFREALALRRAVFGNENADTAVSVSDLANTLKALGRLAEAEPVYREALAIRTSVLGDAHPLTASTSRSLARTIRDRGRTAEAAAAFRDAAALTATAHGENARETIQIRFETATFLHATEAMAEAEALYRKVLDQAETHLRGEHLTLAVIHASLGNLLREEKRPAEAEPHYRREIEERMIAYGGEAHRMVASATEDLGRVLELQHRPAEALEAYEKGLAIREALGETESRAVARTLARSGPMLMELSRPAEAERQFRRMLAIHTALDGPDSAPAALATRWLANAARAQDRNAEAEVLMRRAIDISERVEGPDSAMTAFDLISLGIHYTGQQRFAEAGPLLERAHTIMAGPPAKEPGLAAARAALSHLRSVTRDFDGAAELLQDVLDDLLADPSRNPIAEADARLVLAQTFVLAGEADKAAEHAAAAEAIYAMEAPDGSSRYTALGVLGDLAMGDGRYEDALATYLRVRAGPDILFAEGGSRADIVLFDIGRAQLALGHTDEAITALEGAVRHIEDVAAIDLQAAFANRTGKIEDKAISQATTYDLLVTAYHRRAMARGDDGDAMARAFHLAQRVIESQAAEALAQMAGREASGDGRLAGLIRERQDLAELWRDRDSALSALLAVPPAERDGDAFGRLSRERDEADARIRAIDEEVRTAFPDYAALHQPEPLDIATVQAALADDQVLLFYADASKTPGTDAATYLWAVASKGAPRWVKLERGPADLSFAVDSMRGLMGVGSQTRGAAALSDRGRDDGVDEILRIAHALHGQLLAPVADMIAGKSLVIVPSRSLSALPFHLLVGERPAGTGDRYRDADWAVRHHAMTMLPSVAALATPEPAASEAGPDRQPYLGFANPLLVGRSGDDRRAHARATCDAASPQLASAGRDLAAADFTGLYRNGTADVAVVRRLEPLPETADEACAIAATLGAGDESVLLAARANETAVRDLSENGRLAAARIVHFATHALVTGEISGLAEPAIVLSPPDEAEAGNDGLLTASEVATLRLAADWVILSACNTAAGDGGGEALSGLARAFFYAGARSLMVSHWPVNSDAAVRLASDAVDLYASGEADKATALQQAMIAEIGRGGRHADPSNWAPFILVGRSG